MRPDDIIYARHVDGTMALLVQNHALSPYIVTTVLSGEKDHEMSPVNPWHWTIIQHVTPEEAELLRRAYKGEVDKAKAD